MCGLPTNKAAQGKFCEPCVKARNFARTRKRVKGPRPCVSCGGPTGKKAAQARLCKTCQNRKIADNANRRYHADRERHLEIASRSRATHRRLFVERTRGWREKNREQVLARRREQYAANPDLHRDRALNHIRKNYKAVRDRQNAGRRTENGRARSLLNKNRRRARLLGTESRFTAADWRVCKEMFGNRCAYCLKANPLEIEHVQPVSRGGADTVDNIVPACHACNASKGARSLLEWARRGGGLNVRRP